MHRSAAHPTPDPPSPASASRAMASPVKPATTPFPPTARRRPAATGSLAAISRHPGLRSTTRLPITSRRRPPAGSPGPPSPCRPGRPARRSPARRLSPQHPARYRYLTPPARPPNPVSSTNLVSPSSPTARASLVSPMSPMSPRSCRRTVGTGRRPAGGIPPMSTTDPAGDPGAREIDDFASDVLDVVESIPPGRVMSDGSMVPGHERAALRQYRKEDTPLRPSADGSGFRVDMRRARWRGLEASPQDPGAPDLGPGDRIPDDFPLPGSGTAH